MLIQLEIQNIALIDKVSIELGEGFNILTGETGAGKSIIIDSINAILGERVSKDLIRTGKDKAVVEAVFQIENERIADIFEKTGIVPEEDGTVIVSREFNLMGKNTCRINGKMVTVSVLRELGEKIIDIHGQYDNQSLLRTESHIDLLDSFGGDNIQVLKQGYLKLLTEYKGIRSKLKALSGDKNERERKTDLLKFQIEEIKKAKLKAGEEEELEKQRLLLVNSEKVIGVLSKAYDLLFSGGTAKASVFDGINEALVEVNGIAKLDDKFAHISKTLEDLNYQIEDVSEVIRKERDSVEYDPSLLEQIEERLDIIFKLKRKYGNTIGEILTCYKKIEQEYDDLIKSKEVVTSFNEQLDKLNNEIYDLAKKLNNERKKAADILESSIGNELEELEMKKARFKVSMEFEELFDTDRERKYFLNGLDRVEFLISTNAGEPLKPLSKIASGGEMSRVMLAIKTILANVDKVPTLIFDEIDIGVSGRTAQKLGEKLSFISKNHQVICVTHLAQIACMADEHYLIEKETIGDNTQTLVKKLEDMALKQEIARIIGGANISDITIRHAEEMLKDAKRIKNN